MPRMSSAAGLAALAVLAGASTGASAGSTPSALEPQPLQYVVDADWSPATRTLSGTETIALHNRGSARLATVWVRLWPNNSIPGEADGCRRPRAWISLLAGASVSRTAVACSAVELQLDHPLASGEAASVTLRFTVLVPTNAAQFGRSAGIDLLGRALPLLAVHDRAGWHLNPDTATGDPTYSLASAWRATIRVPAALDVASTGAELSDTVDPGTGQRVITVAAQHARDFGLAIGRLRRITATVDGVQVRVFAAAGGAMRPAQQALRTAVAAVRTYTRWYGSYGSPELDLVITDLGFNSQEFPELVFTDPDRATVAHEVAHQWFYGIVGDDQYSEPWLDESFAAWNEEQFVPGGYPCNLSHPLGPHRGGLDRGLSYYESRGDEYEDVVYRGGSCALSALERMLGRGRFLSLLRTEVARYRYGIVTTRDFIALLTQTDAAVAHRWTSLIGLR